MYMTPYSVAYLYQSRHCPKNWRRKLFRNVWMYLHTDLHSVRSQEARVLMYFLPGTYMPIRRQSWT